MADKPSERYILAETVGPLWPSPSLAPQRQSERQRPLPSPAPGQGAQHSQTETRAQDAGPAGPRWRRCVPAALSEGWWSGFLICGRVLRARLGLGPVCGSEGLWARVSRRRCGYRQAVVRLWCGRQLCGGVECWWECTLSGSVCG